MTWNKLLCNLRELQLSGTLSGGQSFRWSHNEVNNEWIGVFSKTLWKLRENDDHLQYQVIASLHNQSNTSNKNKNTDFTKVLEDYFRLDVNLGEYYKKWSEKDELFEKACRQFYGIRMLCQEPVENLFSFICSQNNHISRISTMVEKLCTHYGEKICEYEGNTYYAFPEVDKLSVLGYWVDMKSKLKNKNRQINDSRRRTGGGPATKLELSDIDRKFLSILGDDYGIGLPGVRVEPIIPQEPQLLQENEDNITVPTNVNTSQSTENEEPIYLEVLSSEVETELRNLGFGYRAKFIQKSAAQIVEWGGEEWFHSLQDMKYIDAKQELMKLHGIGPKVADCICLMSLNHLEALPVDTHVYQIAAQNYLPHLRGKKNVTEKMYTEIGDHFRMLFVDMAGWAHTVLFCADLKKFQQQGTECNNCNSKPKKKRKRAS